MKRFLVAFCALLAANGCGDSAPSSNAPTVQEAASDCARITTCDLGNDAMDRAGVTSRSECAGQREADLRNDNGIEAFLADGSVRVSDANLEACRDALAASPCVDFDTVPACDDIYVGTLPENAGCSADIQCVSGACNAFPDQCGTCLAPADIGQPCDLLNDNCVPSTLGSVSCQPDGLGATCVLDTIDHLMVTLDESCDSTGGVVRYCASPYYCNQDNFCAERDPAGTACNPDFDSCELSAVCAQTGLGTSCLTIVNVTAANEPCGPLAGNTIGRCDSTMDLYCGDGDVCHLLAGDGTENSECLADSDCNAGLICADPDFLGAPGTCEPTNKPDGTSCEVDAECASRSCTQNPVTFQRTCAAALVCP